MFELHAIPADVIGCFGRAAALDQLAASELNIRSAPNELLRLGEHHRLAELEAELGILDPSAIVVDLSCGLAVWVLRGDERFEAFSRLSELKLPKPPANIQGLVAHVPAKVIVRHDELLLIVSSVVSHHLRERVLLSCLDLLPEEGAGVPGQECVVEDGAMA